MPILLTFPLFPVLLLPAWAFFT